MIKNAWYLAVGEPRGVAATAVVTVVSFLGLREKWIVQFNRDVDLDTLLIPSARCRRLSRRRIIMKWQKSRFWKREWS